jgi:predicted CopG family antitoxin
VGREARRHLETLLSIKHKAQDEEVDPTVTEARKAIRAMRSILKLAAQA